MLSICSISGRLGSAENRCAYRVVALESCFMSQLGDTMYVSLICNGGIARALLQYIKWRARNCISDSGRAIDCESFCKDFVGVSSLMKYASGVASSLLSLSISLSIVSRSSRSRRPACGLRAAPPSWSSNINAVVNHNPGSCGSTGVGTNGVLMACGI